MLYGRRFTNENVHRSNRYYELALKQNPDDFEAAYRLGLNHYVELKSDNIEEAKKNREMGLAYLERAASTPGAPERVRSLVASISSRLGKHELSLQYLVDLYLQTEDVEQHSTQIASCTQEEFDQLESGRRGLRFRRPTRKFPYLSATLYAILGEPS